MLRTWRFVAVLLGVALGSAGCDKSGSSSSGKPADETYGKKLVGVWEDTSEDSKGAKGESMTMEFKADGAFKVSMGPVDLITGTWKVAKEEGKTVTVDTEAAFAGFGEIKGQGKTEKKTLSAVFEDANTVVISQTGDKPKTTKFKRKS
jgi:hypothetical protein